MPIKSKRETICEGCGKKFVIECNDDIRIEDLKKLNNRLCLKCKIVKMITGR